VPEEGAGLMSVLWILGEAKSGKSELAEEIFARLPGTKFYIGTLPRRPEWTEKINKHVNQRPKEWATIEIADRLYSATETIGRSGNDEAVATLLDGWGVYARQKAVQWDRANPESSLADEDRFVDLVYSGYSQLVQACHYLIVVDHISAEAPTSADYESDPVAWRVRAVVCRCLAAADKVIYHDREDVTHKDRAYIEQAAEEMMALGAAGVAPKKAKGA
jgi:adenosyl cobinamide kinase/adenosyl cobinamide phosphate guanylyltransferase